MSLPHWRYHGVNYPKVHDGSRWRYAHTVAAERALGKPLPKGAQIHHVDENPQNTVNSNLVICQDMAYHKLLHMRASVLKFGGNPNTDLCCHKCCTAKPRDAFHVNKTHSSGRQSYCKECALRMLKRRKDVKGKRTAA